MLIYHPAFDAYHCLFRMLKILQSQPSIELDALRIVDFYMAFPAEMENVQLPRNGTRSKKLAAKIQNPYHGPMNPRNVFHDLAQIQAAALGALASSGVISAGDLETGTVVRMKTSLPEALEHSLQLTNDLERYIVQEFAQIPLRGPSGLKYRTGLMEYRYDAT